MWWRRAAFALNGTRGAPAWWRGLAPASPYPKPPKPAIAATRRFHDPPFPIEAGHFRWVRYSYRQRMGARYPYLDTPVESLTYALPSDNRIIPSFVSRDP